MYIDGIHVSKQQVQQAEVNYDTCVRQFNDVLDEINLSFHREINSIETKSHSGIHHNKTLEREITQSLVEIVRQKSILDDNFKQFSNRVNGVFHETDNYISKELCKHLNKQYDLIEALFHVLGTVTTADNALLEAMMDSYNYLQQIKQKNSTNCTFAFAYVNESTVDFQMCSQIFNSFRYNKAQLINQENTSPNRSPSKKSTLSFDTLQSGSLCLMKLYRIHYQPSDINLSIATNQTVRVFFVLNDAQISNLLKYGWERVGGEGNIVCYVDPGTEL